MKWGAILHKKWMADTESATKIRGWWIEDDAEYEIVVPSGLREVLIDLQNFFCERYRDLEVAREKVAKIEKFFDWSEGIQPSDNDETLMPHTQQEYDYE